MRKVFLDELPLWKEGAYKGSVNWSKCVGLNIRFVNNEISGYVTVIDYSVGKILIKYNNKSKWIYIGNFKKGYLGDLVKPSLKETHPHIANMLLNQDEAITYTHGSGKEAWFKCPHCGVKKKMRVSTIVRYGMGCVCGDGFSYPEKFFYSLLSQLDIKFVFQKKFKWSKGRVYDFFIPSKNIILEIHGMQHYNGGFSRMGERGRNLKDEEKNDAYKKHLAFKNNYTNYIEIDARYSEQRYIKDSIINNNLLDMLNMDYRFINWDACGHFAINSNITVMVRDMWNNNIDVNEISQNTGLSKGAIRKYLKDWAEIGLCDYDPKITIQKGWGNKKRAVICLNNKKVFESLTEASKWCGLKSYVSISYMCSNVKGYKSTGKHPETGEKLRWMYYDDYIKQNQASNT